jgi:hypothetical protein
MFGLTVLPRNFPVVSASDTDAEAVITNASSYDRASRPIGAAHARRMILLALIWDDTTDNLANSSLGGATAQIHTQRRQGASNAAIATALVPTGTTGTVSVGFAGTVQTIIYRLNRSIHFRKTTAFNTAQAAANATSASLVLRVPPLGFAYAVAAGSGVFTVFDAPVATTANHGPFESLSGLWGLYLNPTRQIQQITFKANKSATGNIALVAASFWGDS